MNYLPFAGSWFYGATTPTEIASFYSSWGLLEVAPTGIFGGTGGPFGIPSMASIVSIPSIGRR